MDTEIFKQLGFTEREIKVYIALLELGSSTAGPIAAKSRLPHTKVYDTLDRLIHKGLVSYVVVSKTRHFEASDPKEILNIIDEQKRRFSETLKELELKRKFAKQKQTAIVHEGYKAFKAMYNRIIDELQPGDFYYAFAFKEHYKGEAVPAFFRSLHRRLGEKGITDKLLGSFQVKEDIKRCFKSDKKLQMKFAKLNTPVGVAIVKNKVIQMMWGELPTAIEITSRQVYEQYKVFFEELWKEAKK